MAIPVQQFPWMDFAQANPAIVGAQQGLGLAEQGAKVAQMPLQMQLLKQQLGEGPFRQQLLQAQAAQAPLRTQQLEQAVQFGPLKQALQVSSQEQQGQRFGPAYQLARAVNSMPAASKAQWIAENQEAWNSVLATLGQTALPGQKESPAQQAVQAEVAKLYPQYSQPAPQGAPQVTPALADQYQQLAPGAQAPTPEVPERVTPSVVMKQTNPLGLPPQIQQTAFGTAKDEVEKTKLANLMTANLDASKDPIVRKRAQNGITMLNWLNENKDDYVPRINNALEYSGALGRGKRYFDSWLNKNQDKTADYDWFKGGFAVALSNQIRFLEGMGATDMQTKDLRALVDNPEKFIENPTRARKALNEMFKMYDDLSFANLKTAQPINPGVYQKIYNLKPFKGNYLDMGKTKQKVSQQEKLADPLGIR